MATTANRIAVERLYRRAAEDFHSLIKFRDLPPSEKYEEPNELHRRAATR